MELRYKNYLECRFKNKYTALIWACRGVKIEIVEKLLAVDGIVVDAKLLTNRFVDESIKTLLQRHMDQRKNPSQQDKRKNPFPNFSSFSFGAAQQPAQQFAIAFRFKTPAQQPN